MAKIDTATHFILIGGRCALGAYAWNATRKLTLISATVGLVAGTFFLDAEDNPKVGAHISLSTLTMRKHPKSIEAIVAFAFIISHCDHHALDGIPFGPAFGGYVAGCYCTHLWSTTS